MSHMGNLNALFHERETELLARANVLTGELKQKFGQHGELHLRSNMEADGRRSFQDSGANPAADALAVFHSEHPEFLVHCKAIGETVGQIISRSNQGLL